jgi:exonuclease III
MTHDRITELNATSTSLRIEESEIPGMPRDRKWGLVAKRNIPAGKTLGLYSGVRMSEQQRRAAYPRDDQQYVFDTGEQEGDGRFIDAADPRMAGMMRFINSTGAGQSPNANALSEKGVTGRMEIAVTTTRDIVAGEEILLDYGSQYPWAKGKRPASLAPRDDRGAQRLTGGPTGEVIMGETHIPRRAGNKLKTALEKGYPIQATMLPYLAGDQYQVAWGDVWSANDGTQVVTLRQRGGYAIAARTTRHGIEIRHTGSATRGVRESLRRETERKLTEAKTKQAQQRGSSARHAKQTLARAARRGPAAPCDKLALMLTALAWTQGCHDSQVASLERMGEGDLCDVARDCMTAGATALKNIRRVHTDAQTPRMEDMSDTELEEEKGHGGHADNSGPPRQQPEGADPPMDVAQIMEEALTNSEAELEAMEEHNLGLGLVEWKGEEDENSERRLALFMRVWKMREDRSVQTRVRYSAQRAAYRVIHVTELGAAYAQYVTPYTAWTVTNEEGYNWTWQNATDTPAEMIPHVDGLFGAKTERPRYNTSMDCRIAVYTALTGGSVGADAGNIRTDLIKVGAVGKLTGAGTCPGRPGVTGGCATKKGHCMSCGAADHTSSWKWARQGSNVVVIVCRPRPPKGSNVPWRAWKRRGLQRKAKLVPPRGDMAKRLTADARWGRHVPTGAPREPPGALANVIAQGEGGELLLERKPRGPDPEKRPQEEAGGDKNDDLTIIQWNMGRRRTALRDLLREAAERGADVICIQEAGAIQAHNDEWSARGFNLYRSDVKDKVAILLHKRTAEKLKVKPAWYSPDHQAMGVPLQTRRGTLWIANAYAEMADTNKSEQEVHDATKMHLDIMTQMGNTLDPAQHGSPLLIATMDANETLGERDRAYTTAAREKTYPNQGSAREVGESTMAPYAEHMVDAHKWMHPVEDAEEGDMDTHHTHVVHCQKNGRVSTSTAKLDYAWVSTALRYQICQCELIDTKRWGKTMGEAPSKEYHKAVATTIAWTDLWSSTGDDTQRPQGLQGTRLPDRLNLDKLQAPQKQRIARQVHHTLENKRKLIDQILESGDSEVGKAQRLLDLLTKAALDAAKPLLGTRPCGPRESQEPRRPKWARVWDSAADLQVTATSGALAEADRSKLTEHIAWMKSEFNYDWDENSAATWVGEAERREIERSK